MNEQQLRYIHAIEREESIQKASSSLGKSPSTVARVVKNCENELGAVLFRRVGRKMILTPEGETVTDMGKRILTCFLRLEEWVDNCGCRKEGNPGKGHLWTEHEIRYLLCIREYQNISRAAQELYVAQPSLSQMLKELETDLGAEVFLRGKGGVEESFFGRELLNRLEEVRDLFTQLRIELEEFQELKKGTITFCIPLNPGTYLLPRIIPAFRERFPGIRIRIRENNSHGLEQLMIGGKVDFYVLHFHEEREQVRYEMFFEDPFYLVIPKSKKLRLGLPDGKKLTGEDLAGLREEPFVMVSARQKLRLVADQILRNAKLEPDICCTTKSMETVKRLVAAGTGVTFLPGSYLNLYSGVEGLVCYPLDRSLEGVWKLAVACPKEGKMPKSSREFLRLLTETLGQMSVSGSLHFTYD